MNRTWRFHPKDYEIGENERLYERMAAKGWLLKKRGLYLSRFERAEPEKRRYRIELSVPEGIDAEQELPEEQVDLYEECGWSFVTRQHLIHVFTAPEGSDAPEFYQDSAAQADTLKALRRQYRFSWVFYLILFGIEIWFILAVGGLLEDKGAAELRVAWYRLTAFFLFYLTFINWKAIEGVYGEFRLWRLYKRLKKGKTIEHALMKRHWPHRIFSFAMGILLMACAIGGIFQWTGIVRCDLKDAEEGPYLLMKDMGFEGESEGTYESGRSLLCDQWYVHETIADSWIYQDIYKMRDERSAMSFAKTLMMNATFAKGPEYFETLEVEGLDAAYQGELECIAVKGRYVYYFTSIDIKPLEALAREVSE